MKIEITPAMIEAGRDALYEMRVLDHLCCYDEVVEAARLVFERMTLASTEAPPCEEDATALEADRLPQEID